MAAASVSSPVGCSTGRLNASIAGLRSSLLQAIADLPANQPLSSINIFYGSFCMHSHSYTRTSVSRAIGRGGPWKSRLFWAQMSLADFWRVHLLCFSEDAKQAPNYYVVDFSQPLLALSFLVRNFNPCDNQSFKPSSLHPTYFCSQTILYSCFINNFINKTNKKKSFPDGMLLIFRYWGHVVGNLVSVTFWDGNDSSWLGCFEAGTIMWPLCLQDWDFMSIWCDDLQHIMPLKPTWLSASLNALVTVLV